MEELLHDQEIPMLGLQALIPWLEGHGFVVNVGGATAKDVLQLISDVQSKVFAAHGVRLEPEVLVLGEE